MKQYFKLLLLILIISPSVIFAMYERQERPQTPAYLRALSRASTGLPLSGVRSQSSAFTRQRPATPVFNAVDRGRYSPLKLMTRQEFDWLEAERKKIEVEQRLRALKNQINVIKSEIVAFESRSMRGLQLDRLRLELALEQTKFEIFKCISAPQEARTEQFLKIQLLKRNIELLEAQKIEALQIEERGFSPQGLSDSSGSSEVDYTSVPRDFVKRTHKGRSILKRPQAPRNDRRIMLDEERNQVRYIEPRETGKGITS